MYNLNIFYKIKNYNLNCTIVIVFNHTGISAQSY